MRMVDFRCDACGRVEHDIMATPDENRRCVCGGPAQQIWWQTRTLAPQWSPQNAVVVHKDRRGNISYPGRVDDPVPPGFERVEMRDFRSLDRFCKEHKVQNEIQGCSDKGGTGRGLLSHLNRES